MTRDDDYKDMGFGSGDCVAQDYAEAVEWYGLVAEAGYAPAQGALGMMYATVKGVESDCCLAYMWFALSAAQGHEPASAACDMITEFMTPAQIAEAKQMVQDRQKKQ